MRPTDGNHLFARLRFFARLNPSRSEVRALEPETLVDFVPMEAVDEGGGLNLCQKKRVDEVYSGYTYFRNGDVVVAKITPCFENGKGAFVTGLVHGVGFGTTELHVLRPGPHLDPRFLAYLTLSAHFRDAGTAAMTGAAGQKRVPEEFVKNYLAWIPSGVEQQAIVSFLDDKCARLDALIARKQRMIDLLLEKRGTRIVAAVTRGLVPGVRMKSSGVQWVGQVPDHWSVAPVFAKYDVQLGKMLNPEASSGANQAPYVRNANVQWDHVVLNDVREMSFSTRERSKFRLRYGDLLVCEGGDVGRTAMWRGELEDCFYQKAIHRVRPLGIQDEPRFFYYLMVAAAHRGAFLAEGNQSTIIHLTADKLRRHRFPFPPITEQRAIVRSLDQFVTRIDHVVRTEETIIEKLREYRQSLISGAVTGQLPVEDRELEAVGI